MFVCSEELKEGLTKWARAEKRTVSSLVEKITSEAFEKWQAVNANPKERPKNLTIAWLIDAWGDINELATRSGIDTDSLQRYIKGNYPSNKHVVQLDRLLKHPDDGHLIDTSELLDIRDNTFGKQHGDGSGNKEQPSS